LAIGSILMPQVTVCGWKIRRSLCLISVTNGCDSCRRESFTGRSFF